jgi:hypothetical protein
MGYVTTTKYSGGFIMGFRTTFLPLIKSLIFCGFWLALLMNLL